MSFFATLLHPSSPLLAPPSPAPAPPLLNACVPGQAGMPDGVLGEVLCGTWAPTDPAAVGEFIRERWPLLLTALVVLIAVPVMWRMLRRRIWRTRAARARWLHIIPPVTATPAATVNLWRLLATALPAPHWWTLRPARIVWEVEADQHGMRVGLWLPAGVNPTAVLRLLQRAWPGVRAEQTAPPVVPGGTATTLAVLPTQPDWLPLVDDTSTANSRNWETAPPDEDRMGAVFGGLAAAGRTGGGLLQIHVSRAPAHRKRMMHRATTHPERARKPRGASRAVGLLGDGLRALILGVLNAVTPGPSGSKPRRTTHDPYLAELARQARGKYAAAPHLLVAIYATATGPTKDAALSAASDLTSGFGLLSSHFIRRRLRGGTTAAAQRWVPEARMSLATVSETAALAGLPAEPSLYGLPAAASRRRPGGRDVFRAGPATRRPGPTRPAPPKPTDPHQSDNDDDPPAVWSAP